MPWCATCAKYLTPPTVNVDGTCPTCGHAIDAVESRSPAAVHRHPWRRLPWHVQLLLVIFAVYLTFRIVQGIDWLLGEI